MRLSDHSAIPVSQLDRFITDIRHDIHAASCLVEQLDEARHAAERLRLQLRQAPALEEPAWLDAARLRLAAEPIRRLIANLDGVPVALESVAASFGGTGWTVEPS